MKLGGGDLLHLPPLLKQLATVIAKSPGIEFIFFAGDRTNEENHQKGA